ncbi:MAG: efflux RND transporter periplasmic adaptor subunit [Anaerolineae bacterium]|nr:efflux RND transporter periplasmic adaptor subunit [Anaerolineae bacterium]
MSQQKRPDRTLPMRGWNALLTATRDVLRPKRVSKRWLLIGAAFATVAVVTGVLWLRRSAGQGTGSLQEFVVERGNVVATVASTGEVYAPRQAELCFDVNRIPLIELNVAPGQQVRAGDVLARIDTTTLQRALTQAEAELTVAQDNLEKARNPYTELDLTRARLAVESAEIALAEAQENLETVRNPDVQAAERAVQEAAAALQSAQSQLIVAQNDPSNAAQLRTLEYEAVWYQNNYWAAKEKFERGEISQEKLNWEYSNMLAAQERLKAAQAKAESSLASAQNQLAKAQSAYQEAQENLARVKRGPDATDLAKAKNQVAQAQYNLDKARADLAAVEAGPAPKDVEVAEAKVVSAQAALEEARAALEAATMRAPFDGTVVSVGAAVGDLVSSSTIVVTLADLSNLRARAIVDETDITKIEIGQEVTITFDAFPGARFRGQVLEVPLQGKLTQNVLTYEVPVSLEGTEGISLKPGMTANLSIMVGRAENVLLVPALAVQQGEEGTVVLVRGSPRGSPGLTPVLLGLSDGVYVEVKKGLNEGDRVLVEYQAPQEEMPGSRGFGGMMPGGVRGMVR